MSEQRTDQHCCDRWDPAVRDCVHTICPGCYGSKGHDQNVCDECHTYNVAEKFEPYLAKYGPDNVRCSCVEQDFTVPPLHDKGLRANIACPVHGNEVAEFITTLEEGGHNG